MRDGKVLIFVGRWRSTNAGKTMRQEQIIPKFTSRALWRCQICGMRRPTDRVLTHVNIATVLKFQVRSGLTLKYCVIANRTMLAAHTLERTILDNELYIWGDDEHSQYTNGEYSVNPYFPAILHVQRPQERDR